MVSTGTRPTARLVGLAVAAARRRVGRGWCVAVALAVLLVAVPTASGQGPSGRRLALVVGNDSYTDQSALRNAVNDARTVATALGEVGFAVTRVENANRARLTSALSSFAGSLRGDDVALFYFAGHGVQVDGVNYLMPTDYAGRTLSALRFDAVSASDIQEMLRPAQVAMLVFDACRNNPYRGVRGEAGLAPMEARGTLIAYAAGAGEVAADSAPGVSNGLFTSKFVEALRTPGLTATDLFRRVRRDVYEASNAEQWPAVYDDLLSDFMFRPASAAGVAPSVAALPVGATAASEAALGLDRAARRRIQRGLAEAGFDPGPADGVFGPATRTAIRGWQAARGMTSTGYLEGVAATALGSPSGSGASAGVGGPASTVLQQETVFWQSIAQSTDATDFQAYLEQFPTGVFAQLARNRMNALGGAPGDTPVATFVVDPPGALAPGTEFRDCDDCPEMVVVPAGRFRMGCVSGSDDCRNNERPVHEVDVNSFTLGKYEVTRGEFATFVSMTGHVARGCRAYVWTDPTFAGPRWEWKDRAQASWQQPEFNQRENEPVVCVNWQDASAYVRWLSEETGEEYRLPSEAEWEYAARAGTTTASYWGDDKAHCTHANGADATSAQTFERQKYRSTFSSCADGEARTAPVGSLEPNAFGLYDMTGNVWEWVQDCYHPDYDGAPRDGSAWTWGADCGRRVSRGGSWRNPPSFLRSAIRALVFATKRDVHTGFRVAKTLN